MDTFFWKKLSKKMPRIFKIWKLTPIEPRNVEIQHKRDSQFLNSSELVEMLHQV
jgi:hypothetical protein